MQALPERIVTERLLLREWDVADVAALTKAIVERRDHLVPWMPWAASEPMPAEERTAMIAEWRARREAGGNAVYGVFLGDDPDRIVGGCGLHARRGPGVLEIGYWLHVDHTGRGYATELAAALTDAAFAVASVERVEIHHDRANVRSAGVPRRLGFTLVGELADVVTAPGEEGVDCCWVVTCAEWQGGLGRYPPTPTARSG